MLLIGPEMLKVGNKSLMTCVYEQIAQAYDHEIKYLEDVGLLLFQDDTDKLDLPGDVRELYNKMEIQTEVFKKILEIPFSLILSLTPDNLLSEAAYRYGVPHEAAHFRHNGMASTLEYNPCKERPLFYNLFGDLNDEESLILDYEDLYEFLRKVLGSPGLPEKIRIQLERAKSFFFIGFDFQKWYTQLILQLITGKGRRGARKVAIKNKAFTNDRTENFVISQFKLNFLDKKRPFLDELYEIFQEAGSLRKLGTRLTEDARTLSQNIRRLIGKGELQEALKLLTRLTIGKASYNEAVSLSSNYEILQAEIRKGIVRSEDKDVRNNRIINAALELLGKLELNIY